MPEPIHDSPFRRLDTLEALAEAVAQSAHEPVVLFKHSALCGLSSMARRQMLRLTGTDAPPVYEIVVQEARHVAREIETRLGIRHETPQVIILRDRQPVYDASHRRVTAESIRTVLANQLSP